MNGLKKIIAGTVNESAECIRGRGGNDKYICPKSQFAGVKYGLRGEITVNGKTYNSVMVSQGLDDEEIADVIELSPRR